MGTSALDEYEMRLGELEDADPDNEAVEDALSYLAEMQDDMEEHSAYAGCNASAGVWVWVWVWVKAGEG